MASTQPATANVHLWGCTLGTVTWNPTRQVGHFEYAPQFRKSGLEIAPFTVPLSSRTFSFPNLNENVFKGLPGFLADSLPDKFGNTVIDAWLARHGRGRHHLNPVERLCYIGSKGMGALEYSPALGESSDAFEALDVAVLVDAINLMLADQKHVEALEYPPDYDQALHTLLQVGISADGSRAKAVVARNRASEEVWPGQLKAPDGFDYWLLKFDGITGNRDKEAADPQGYGSIEYAYHLMAVAAGITMSECQLLQENGRRHFLTRRFDRTAQGDKIHRQSLCAMGHMDFDAAGTYSYEEAMHLMQRLGLTRDALEEQFRRMTFNVLARNHDDHPKNIAFLMDRDGEWSLSPAYDLTFAYNPQGHWTRQHQMSLNGKRDGFTKADLIAVARGFALPDARAHTVVDQVAEAVSRWPLFADQAEVAPHQVEEIADSLRLHLG